MTRWRRTRRGRDERGAVAAVTAAAMLLLMALGALSVDIGNAYVHKRNMQQQADFAAMAGTAGNDLPGTAAGGTCLYGTAAKATDQAIIDAAKYLSTNYPTRADGSDSVAPGDLVDCNMTNGEADYGTFTQNRTTGAYSFVANKNQLGVVSQYNQVDFGLGRALGYNSTKVAGIATAEIKSPTLKTLPMYISQTCRWGQQTIAQPTNGHSSDGVNLANSSDNNTYVVESTLATNPASTATPPVIAVGATTATITITGTNLDTVTQLGFYESDPTTPPSPITVLKANFVSQNATAITVTVPTTVTTKQDTWFVRVLGTNKKNGGSPEWTPVTNKGNADKTSNLAALPFSVGNATLSCTQGSNSGNFGTLDLFNTSAGAPAGQWQNIGYNIAKGLQYGLLPYPSAKLTPANQYTCVSGQDGVAVTWPADGTNCVGTKTGLDSNAAQAGFIDGINGQYTGLLNTTSNQCAFNYPSGSHTTTSPTGFTINNDVLSCFFKNDTVTVGDVSSSTYAGPAVIDQSIYNSPRFVQVPVLGSQPSSGSSNNYEIIDFQPAFITDQPSSAKRLTGTPSTYNGFTWSNNNKAVSAVNVVFLNPKALPDPPLDKTGHYVTYTGSGRKVPSLVN